MTMRVRRMSAARCATGALLAATLLSGCRPYWAVRHFHNPIENPCDAGFEAGDKHRCLGLLGGFSNDAGRLEALPRETPRTAIYNHVEGPSQYGIPIANVFARRIRVEDMKPDQEIVIGAIRMLGKGIDKRYKVGDDVTPRTYTVVAYRDETFPMPADSPFKRVVGKWKLYDTRSNPWQVVSSGLLKQCEHESEGHDSRIADADFLSCQSAKAIQDEAKR